MKKVFLLAIASVIALGSFANPNHKVGKHAKKTSTTVCPPTCPRSSCSHS
jgi:hypothetical protein